MKITTNEGYNQVIETLKAGGLVIAPSDTVYGLLVDATNEAAVQKLIKFKNRPPGKPISVFVADRSMMDNLAYITDKQEKLFDQLLPGPFTIVLPSKHKVSRLLESERGTIGLRLPQYTYITELVKAYGKPITATSANLSGRPSHYSVESLLNELPESKKELIDLIIDGGKLPRNKPSTVMDLTTPTLKIMRHGDVVWTEKKRFVTKTPKQTRKVGEFIINKHINEAAKKPFVLIFKGDMGAGKTEMIKGMGELFKIDEIISPTYVIYYEYDIQNDSRLNKLYHFDLFQIEDSEEFKQLPLQEMLKPKTLICMEWGDRAGEIIELLKKKAHIVYIEMEYVAEKEREIVINS